MRNNKLAASSKEPAIVDFYIVVFKWKEVFFSRDYSD